MTCSFKSGAEVLIALVSALLASPPWIASGTLPPPTAKTVLSSSLVVADVSVVHPAATSYSRAAARTASGAAASRDALKRRQYHAGGPPAALSFLPLSLETYGHLGVSVMQVLNALAEAALASSGAGADVTKAEFISRALREPGVTLCMGNELIGKVCMFMLLRAVPARVWACMSHAACAYRRCHLVFWLFPSY
jgi:hypothetical protein